MLLEHNGSNGNHLLNGHDFSKFLDGSVVDLFDNWAAKTPDRIAAEWQGELLTYSGLRTASLHVSKALLTAGVPSRARVPLLTRMSLEMLPAIIGILRIGACLAPMDVAAWSHARIQSALSELSATVAVVTTPCPELQLPVLTVNFQTEWLHAPLKITNDLNTQLDVRRKALCDDSLAWILFTSGTTGKPKGVMVYHRSVYEYAIFGMVGRNVGLEGMRCLLAFSVGFDGCGSVIWTTLTHGRTLVMASGPTFAEVATTCDALLLTPSMLAMLDPSSYDRVRYIVMGAEGPSPDVIRQWITPKRKLFTTYGPTETTCNMTFGELHPDEDVTLGNLLPGFKVILVDEELQECDDYGEALIAGPGVAAGYLNNPELTAKKFIHWHGERFYRTGDLVRRRKDGQLIFAGRADSLVKNRGFLINLESEVEPALLSFPPIRLAVALKWRDKVVAYVQPANVNVEELRGYMKKRFDHFIIPDEFFAMDTFPLNANGKVDRPKLKMQREEMVTNKDDEISLHDGPISVYEALRLAFAKCLHIPLRDLESDSSFTRLGGNSLTAIRLSHILKKHGYGVSVIQILRLDTIELLEGKLKNLWSNSKEPMGEDNRSLDGAVPTTPLQRLFFARSLQNPLSCALIGVTKYIGAPLTTPTAAELHDAFVKAVSAHSIFQMRFDVTNFTASPLGRLNLDWKEVSTSEIDFETACEAAEEQAWHAMKSVTRKDIEMPYFQVTCVSVPERKALAYVWRIHHLLIDVVAQYVLSQDIDRALAGEPVTPGPRMEDFARFMHTYERENMPQAIQMFEDMVKPIPASSVLQFPSPQTPLPALENFDLIRFDAPLALSKANLDKAARNLRITTSTMVYAAWSLFLRHISGWDRVGFRISLSGRTIPWPGAQSLVGCLVDSAPFSASVDPSLTVHTWLTTVHQTTLDILEFAGLALALPESIRMDPRTVTTNVLSFLDMESPSTPNWSYQEKQRHSYPIVWYVHSEDENVAARFEIQSDQIDLAWATEMAGVPARILEGLAKATEETLVGELVN
ncbi:putative nonribosomal peptide synthase [Pyrenochaeta sp. MPI-SDFR-AT-0127]|nr:putative nonribosomal peptide synthase [Pyrenochaeta sp. MPI-SDFR-AT-0127]